MLYQFICFKMQFTFLHVPDPRSKIQRPVELQSDCRIRQHVRHRATLGFAATTGIVDRHPYDRRVRYV